MFYTLQLNARLQPFDRHDLEDLIEEFLSEGNLGATSGGGTMMDKNGEVEYCDIELELNSPEAVKELLHKLEEIGIPKGSKLYGEDFSTSMEVLQKRRKKSKTLWNPILSAKNVELSKLHK